MLTQQHVGQLGGDLAALPPRVDKENFMAEDSLKKRYAYKLATNFIGLIFNLGMQIIIPRGLGVKAYGDFNFIVNFFQQIYNFFDTGTSTCFYTKLSQRQQDKGLVGFYLYFSIFITFAVSGVVVIAFLFDLNTLLWPGQRVMPIILAIVYVGFLWGVQVAQKINDALGFTIASEKKKMQQKMFAFTVLLLLYFFSVFTLNIFLLFNVLMSLLLIFMLINVLNKNGVSLFSYFLQFKRGMAGLYAKEFFMYSHPLLVASVFSLVANIFDRWLLQYFYGSVQQGIFSLSYQISAICLVFTTAMSPLIIREFSVAHGVADLKQMHYLFRRYVPTLFAIAAFFSCFVAVNSVEVVQIFGGSEYKEARLAVAIMAFYPIYQTYGQLIASAYYASGKTKLYRNRSIVIQLLAIILTYFFLAPASGFGLDLGANGLAIKFVVIAFISTNLGLFLIRDLVGANCKNYLLHQAAAILSFVVLAIISSFVISYFLHTGFFAFVLKGALYTLFAILLILFFPKIMGMSRNDFLSIKRQIAAKVKKK
jgi:O-antigen/teichoic acid export membrane protein